MGECILRIEHVKKTYPNAEPLKDISAQICRGDVISVIGPSGTGKSTLLRCINGLEKPTSGKIYFHDTEVTDPHCDLSAVRKKVGMVFQSFNLFDTLNILDNVAVPPVQLLGRPREQAREEAEKLLEELGVADKARNFPEELSGGQRQRVAIARAVAMHPEMLLLDEPTSALDPTSVARVQNMITGLAESGTTIMFVTHMMRFAAEVSNRVFYLDEGCIYEEGTPDTIFTQPAREKTRMFIRHQQSIELDVVSPEFSPGEFNDRLARFAANTVIERKALMSMQVVFEELVLVQLVHMRRPFSPVHVLIRYSQSEHWTEMELTYGGEEFQPLDGEGDVLEGLKKFTLTSVEHSYHDGVNTLTVRF